MKISIAKDALTLAIGLGVLSTSACGAGQRSGIQGSALNEEFVEPPLGKREPIASSRCEAAENRDPRIPLPTTDTGCRWTPLKAPCERCPVVRAAFADCGFRGQNPDPIAQGGKAFATILHSSVGEYMLAEDGRLTPLPPHLAVVIIEGAPFTFSHIGDQMVSWSNTRDDERCERLLLSHPFTAPFVAPDRSIRGWIEDRPAMRAPDGSWFLLEQPEVSSLQAHMPHIAASGLDAQVWTTFEHARFRILARRWGFPPVVIKEMTLQPVEISSAPPPRGAGPRVPAIVAHDGMSIGGNDRGESELSRSGTFSVELPDSDWGFRALPVELGPQSDRCSKSLPGEDGERHRPDPEVTEVNQDTKIVRTADDALWLVTRRHHVKCTFELDPIRETGGVRPPARMWQPILSDRRDDIIVYAIHEGSSPSASEALRFALPNSPQSEPNPQNSLAPSGGVVGLKVAASGTRLLVMVGGVGLWLDMAAVNR